MRRLTQVGIMNSKEQDLFAQFGKLLPARSDANAPADLVSIAPRRFTLDGVGDLRSIRDNISNVEKPVEYGVAELGKTAGRHQDVLVQDVVYSSADTKSLITFKGTTGINGYTSDNKAATTITLGDIADMAAILQERGVEGFPNLRGAYAVLVHTNVEYDLVAHAMPNEKVFDDTSGYPKVFGRCIGTVHGVAIFSAPHVQKKMSIGKGTPDVYPCYFIGKDAYGRMECNMQAFCSDLGTPRPAFGLEWDFNCVALNNKNMQVLLVQSSL